MTVSVRVTNADAAPLVEEVTVPVPTIGLTAATPPRARLGVAYRYQFEAPGVTFGLAHGAALPDGLTLSASGLLSGTPAELGRFPVGLTLTSGDASVATGTINLHVSVGEGALEISQFRTIAPGDWFVQVVNTTGATIPLAGWRGGLQQPDVACPQLVPLGTGALAPGATAVVTTAASLRSQLDATSFAASAVPLESGFEVVAPNGAVTDAAGVTGALPELVEGSGATYVVRDGLAEGHPVDTASRRRDRRAQPAGIACR